MAPPQFPTGLRAIRYELSPIRRLKVKGLRVVVFGGSRPWLIAFVTYRVLVGLRRAVSRRPEHVAIDVLKPGERMLVRTIPVSSGKERKRLLRGR